MNEVGCAAVRLALGTVAVGILIASRTPALAQAWVPPAGAGSISLTFQRIDNTGHRLTDGSLVINGRSLDMGLSLDIEYALTDRLSVSAGVPYVFARYTDPDPPPPFVPFLPGDQCRCWHSGWQDFAFTARYNVANRAFALTPSVSVGVPSHDYNFRGEAVLGRDLKELRIAVDAGQRLDTISPRLSVQGHYSYALVEQVLDIPNNRSNAAAEAAFLFTPKLSARGMLLWQHTHGGLRFGSPPPADLVAPGEVNTPERLTQHDRLLRDNNWRVGGAASYSFPTLDFFASYIAFVRGTDSHAGRVITVGISWPFEVHGARTAPYITTNSRTGREMIGRR